MVGFIQIFPLHCNGKRIMLWMKWILTKNKSGYLLLAMVNPIRIPLFIWGTFESAREEMFRRHGERWSFQYPSSEEQELKRNFIQELKQ